MNYVIGKIANTTLAAVATGFIALAAQAESTDTNLKIEALSTNDPSDPMVVIADTTDSQIVRNINNVLGLYEMMINQKDAIEATNRYLTSDYIQHSPAIPDGAIALGLTFDAITTQQKDFRVVVHRVIAFDDYVWMHVNFINMLNNDPDDAGIAGVDIFRIAEDGTPIEHWDALQIVGGSEDAAAWMAPNIPAGNSNGMF
ncbi:nuclear transport factor 2 family protein [Yoonia sp. MH D7]